MYNVWVWSGGIAMSLDPRTRAELERVGVDVVRGKLACSGSGRGASVRLDVAGAPDPSRGEVEDWLAEQDAGAERTAATRHRQILFWAKVAAISGIVAAVASVITLTR
jgi:hypothetical protein